MRNLYAHTVRMTICLLVLTSLFLSSTIRILTPPVAEAVTFSENAVAPLTDAKKTRVNQSYGKLPLSFEPNRGQTDARVKYLSRRAGFALFLTPNEAVLRLDRRAAESPETSSRKQTAADASSKPTQKVLRMKLSGANPEPQLRGLDEQQGRSNYLIGNDRSKWQTNLPNYARVQYTEVYPGVDLIYYGDDGQLEYDFNVRPGGKTQDIAVAFEGVDKLRLDESGNLILSLGAYDIIEHAPVIYQETESGRQPVAGDWNGDGIDTVGVFRVGSDCVFLLTNDNSTVNVTAGGFCTNGTEVPLAVTGDWNGDGVDSLGVFSPSLGRMFLTDFNVTLIGQAEIQFPFGQNGDIPVAGDWNGTP